jgi:hypothetical protein
MSSTIETKDRKESLLTDVDSTVSKISSLFRKLKCRELSYGMRIKFYAYIDKRYEIQENFQTWLYPSSCNIVYAPLFRPTSDECYHYFINFLKYEDDIEYINKFEEFKSITKKEKNKKTKEVKEN